MKSIRKSTMYKDKNLLLKADPKKKTTWKKNQEEEAATRCKQWPPIQRVARSTMCLPCVSLQSHLFSHRVPQDARTWLIFSHSGRRLSSLFTPLKTNKQTNKIAKKNTKKNPHRIKSKACSRKHINKYNRHADILTVSSKVISGPALVRPFSAYFGRVWVPRKKANIAVTLCEPIRDD